MFIKNYQLIFTSTLLGGTLLAVSSNSWFTAWLGLEINLMSMIPLILIKSDSNLSEAAIKYFLAQALASVILIFSVTLSLQSNLMKNMNLQELLLLSSLALKAGIPPLHFWFPQITPLMNWAQNFVIFTWQKVAPLLLLSNCNAHPMLGLAAFAAITGALGGINQINIKPLLTYSSIAHTGWLVLSALLNITTWLLYFVVYSFLSACIILTTKWVLTESAQELMKSNKLQHLKYLFSFNLFSLGGLPPFLGFTAKISVLALLLTFKMNLLTIIFILSSLVSLYYYYRLTYSMAQKHNKETYISSVESPPAQGLVTTLCLLTNLSAPLLIVLLM